MKEIEIKEFQEKIKFLEEKNNYLKKKIRLLQIKLEIDPDVNMMDVFLCPKCNVSIPNQLPIFCTQIPKELGAQKFK